MFRISLSRFLKAPRALALAAVIACGLPGALIAAEHGEAETLSRAELLAAALAGDPSARTALRALFSQADGAAIATPAIDLIGGLEGDPVAITDAATLIADIASEALNTQPIVRVSISGDLSLPPGARGWDLGSPDSPTFAGFTKLTQGDRYIVVGASGGVQRPGGEGLLSDGLINVRKIFLKVDVPDGVYRLILLTDDQGNQIFVNPLGQAIIVNGVRTIMPGSSPSDWARNGVLGAGAQLAGDAQGTGTGGATVIFAQVINGRLVIEFESAVNSDILLIGIILEPLDGPSALNMPGDVFADDDDILLAEALIADAIGQTLEKIATAAGDEAARQDILNLDDTAAEVTDAASPS